MTLSTFPSSRLPPWPHLRASPFLDHIGRSTNRAGPSGVDQDDTGKVGEGVESRHDATGSDEWCLTAVARHPGDPVN